MYKHEETGQWEHDFRVDGLPRYRACYGTKKTDAERLHAIAIAVFRARDPRLIHALKRRGAGGITLEQLAQLRDAGRPFVDAFTMGRDVEPWPTVGEAVERYVGALERNENRSKGTVRAAGTQLTRWLAFQDPTTPLDAVATADLEAYQDALKREGYAPNTVTSAVWRVGSLYQWFIRREKIEAREQRRTPRVLYVPLDPETVTTTRTRRERFLSRAEAERLLAATPATLLFPVAAGLLGGFRVDEMIHLRAAFDVDLELGTLAVQKQPDWSPKTHRSVRHVPISTALRPILEQHLAQYSSEEWVTPSFRDPSKPLNGSTFEEHFGRIVERAELVRGRTEAQGVTYHTLRHTFASWLLMDGADLYTVAQLLGNTVKQVELTYGHMSRDHREAAVNRLTKLVTVEAIATQTGETK